MFPHPDQGACARARAAQGGFTLLEVLIGGVVLAIGLLAHLSSTIAAHHLNVEQRLRSEALQTARQFIERLRSDEDWEGLYGRLRTLQDQPPQPAVYVTSETVVSLRN